MNLPRPSTKKRYSLRHVVKISCPGKVSNGEFFDFPYDSQYCCYPDVIVLLALSRSSSLEDTMRGALALAALLQLALADGGKDSRQALRIKLDWTFHDKQTLGTPEEQQLRQEIRHDIMPTAAATISKLLRLRAPVGGPLYVPRECKKWVRMRTGEQRCAEYEVGRDCPDDAFHNPAYFPEMDVCDGLSCRKQPAGPGADADVVFYVTTRNEYCGGESAHTEVCLFDAVSGRPLFALINMCVSNVLKWSGRSNREALIAIMVHEALHSLYFSGNTLRSRIVKPDGVRYTEEETYVQDHRGRTAIRTPRVMEIAREFYDCEEVRGISMEDRDGEFPGHWESDILDDDVMAPSGNDISKRKFGELTLALAEDSGWYIGNWDQVGHNALGYKAGCSYINGNCTLHALSVAGQQAGHPTYCSGGALNGDVPHCSADYKWYGYCAQAGYNPNCPTIETPLKQAVKNPEQPWVHSFCFDPKNEKVAAGQLRDYFGANSRCIAKREIDSDLNFRRNWPVCVRMGCNEEGVLRLTVKNVSVDCPSFQTLDATVFPGWEGELGPCPDNDLICESLGCLNDCSGHGDCLRGKCHCHIAWSGDDCGEPTCTPETCEGTCLLGKGICIPASDSKSMKGGWRL